MDKEKNIKDTVNKILITAIQDHNIELVRSAIKDGANINMKLNNGMCLIDFAIILGNEEICNELLNQQNLLLEQEGYTPTFVTALFSPNENIFQKVMNKTIEQKGNFTTDQLNKLFYKSVKLNSVTAAKRLVDLGVDVNIKIKGKKQKTEKDNNPLFSMIDQQVDQFKEFESYKPMLEVAINDGNFEICEFLLNNKNIKLQQPKTIHALSAAEMSSNDKVYKLVLDKTLNEVPDIEKTNFLYDTLLLLPMTAQNYANSKTFGPYIENVIERAKFITNHKNFSSINPYNNETDFIYDLIQSYYSRKHEIGYCCYEDVILALLTEHKETIDLNKTYPNGQTLESLLTNMINHLSKEQNTSENTKFIKSANKILDNIKELVKEKNQQTDKQ